MKWIQIVATLTLTLIIFLKKLKTLIFNIWYIIKHKKSVELKAEKRSSSHGTWRGSKHLIN